MSKTNLFFSLCIIAFSLAQCVTSAKILFLMPIASKSHKNVFDPLIEALATGRGHEITVISPLKTSKNPNVKEIVPLPLDQVMGTMKDGFQLRSEGRLSFLTSLNVSNIDRVCSAMYENEDVKLLMKNHKFDLIIGNGLMNQCAFGLVAHFKCPFALLTTLPAPGAVAQLLGNNFPSSFVPEPFLPLSNRMTFKERILNLMVSSSISWFGSLYWYPRMEEIYRRYCLPDAAGLTEINKNISLLLMNSHFSLTHPRPLLPSVVEVGGMHCREGQPLAKDFEEFVAGAKHGVILFSLGSIVQAKNMPERIRKVFVNVFGRLKQRVIWKWETEVMPDLPSNVKLSKWVPQQDLLAHKNIKLFITHGGLLSTQEAAYHGVPLIGFPIFADQDMNMAQAEKGGYCLSLEILDLTEEKLEAALNKILNNPEFRERAQGLSRIYRDQPETALQRAVFWTEYIIRHKGAPHMQSASKDLNIFQYHSIDVMLFLAAILFITLFLLKFILWNILVRKVIVRVLGLAKEKVDTSKKLN